MKRYSKDSKQGKNQNKVRSLCYSKSAINVWDSSKVNVAITSQRFKYE